MKNTSNFSTTNCPKSSVRNVEGKKPKVSGLITVYNGEDHIADAVGSLLSQTLSKIEILVIDDGSTDETTKILSHFTDTRLRVISEDRIGRAAALALGSTLARGEYVAILDSDDYAYSERLEKQATFLDCHPEYFWVGCAEERVDNRRNEHTKRVYALDDASVRRQAAKCIPYSHSGVMFRRSIVAKGINYDPQQPYLIDFEFFLRVARQHCVANLPDVLVRRSIRGESYFQRRFTSREQNFKLACLCARAVSDLDLPRWHYIYPVMRLCYPALPNTVKRLIRTCLGLREDVG